MDKKELAQWILDNERLIWSVVNRWGNIDQVNRHGLTRHDLFQACVEKILVKGLEYDPKRGASFSTFIYPWITKSCQVTVYSDTWEGLGRSLNSKGKYVRTDRQVVSSDAFKDKAGDGGSQGYSQPSSEDDSDSRLDLESKLNLLTPKQRFTVVAYAQGFSFREIGQKMNCSHEQARILHTEALRLMGFKAAIARRHTYVVPV